MSGKAKRGLFVTFEGPEGAGKSTQAKLLIKFLEGRGIDAVLTREPGGTAVSKKIREILLDPANRAMVPTTELLLYAADRAQHVGELVVPALESGRWVVCDRFVDSTVAYQGRGRGLDMTLIAELNRVATGGLRPDVTFLIDLPPELGMGRVVKRGAAEATAGGKDRMEGESIEFHRRLRSGFLEIAHAEPGRVRVIDGARPIAAIQTEIRDILVREGRL